MLRRILGSKRAEVTGEERKMIKSERMRWTENILLSKRIPDP